MQSAMRHFLLSDANWGPQDATVTGLSQELPLFVSQSMSAFYIDLLGPLHWMSKRQQVTAASSTEAEIYATDECVKFLLDLVQIMNFLKVKCLPRILSIMITRVVLSGPRKLLPKACIIFKCRKIMLEKMLQCNLLPFVMWMGRKTYQTSSLRK